MIEAAGVSILMKAVDFLFEEGRKILQERKERRQSQRQEVKIESSTPMPAIKVQPHKGTDQMPPDVIQTRENILRQRVSQAVWLAHEAEIRHLLSLIEIHSRNYRLAREQYAKWGSALVPPIIVNNLEEAENAIADTMSKLQATLNAVYGKTIIIPELEEGSEQ